MDSYEQADPGKVANPAPPTEKPLGRQALDEIENYAAQAARVLDLKRDKDPPEHIVKRIGGFTDSFRRNLKLSDKEERIEFCLTFASLWGEQICRAHQWEWVELSRNGDTIISVASPDRAYCCFPLHYFQNLINTPTRDSTVILLFNMLGEKNQPDRKPNAYVPLM